MTLLELTVVILVLLGLVAVLFAGSRAWKRGSDRALCILNLRNVQQGLRGWSNQHGYSPGIAIAGLADFVIGPGLFVETEPVCSGGGSYSTPGGDVIPEIGTLYLDCSLGASLRHVPESYGDW